MYILYIGTGFVGACSAAAAADSGHKVLAYDLDEEKIKKLGSGDRDEIESCLFENGLGDMIVRNKENITFTADYGRVVDFLDKVEVIFMCLPTPEKAGAEGETDLSFYRAAASKLAESLAKRSSRKQENYILLVNKSTLPIKMTDETAQIMEKFGVKNYGVVSNPEFLVEGKAVDGSVRPDRVVVGASNEKDFALMRQLYNRFYNSTGVKYVEVSPYEAAAGKLLANYLLFDRVATTYDVVGRVCESFPNIKFENVRQIIITDNRIGKWGFYDSAYCGGSCFIKDASSLAHQLEEAGAGSRHVRQTLDSNRFQRDHFYSRAETDAGFSWAGKTVAVLGVAFKQDTNDIRNSPAIDIVGHLLDADVKEIRVYDPAAMPMFKWWFDPAKDNKYQALKYFNSEAEALTNTQACLILTDWPQFRQLGEKIMSVCPPPYFIMDGRRMLQHEFEVLRQKGYDIVAVGSPFIKGEKV